MYSVKRPNDTCKDQHYDVQTAVDVTVAVDIVISIQNMLFCSYVIFLLRD